MKNLASLVIGVVALGLSVFAVAHVQKAPAQANTSTVERSNDDTNFGSIPGNEVQGNVFVVGGVSNYSFSQGMNQGTSTVCSIKSPSATTTAVNGGISLNIANSPAYATSYVIGTSLTRNATTTTLAALDVGSSLKKTIVATTTFTQLTDGVVPPNTWFNFNSSTSTATGANQATGVCNVRLWGVS